MKCNCAVGTAGDEIREFVEDALNANRPYRAILEDVKNNFDVVLYGRTLSTHKTRHMGGENNPLRAAVRELRDELVAEMEASPPMHKAMYLAVLKNLDALEDAKPSLESFIKAVQALNGLIGNGSDREALAQFSVRAAAKRLAREGQVGDSPPATP